MLIEQNMISIIDTMKPQYKTLATVILMLLFMSGCDFDVSGDTAQNSFNDSSDNSVNNDIILAEDFFEDDADCSGLIQGQDGSGGFLWKPESEKDGNLVVLFPAEYDEPFVAVFVETIGAEIEAGEFDGFSNPNRQTWRFSSPGSAYTGTVRADLGTQECVWQVGRPEIVQD